MRDAIDILMENLSQSIVGRIDSHCAGGLTQWWPRSPGRCTRSWQNPLSWQGDKQAEKLM